MWVRAAVQMHVQAKVKPHLHASENALPQKVPETESLDLLPRLCHRAVIFAFQTQNAL